MSEDGSILDRHKRVGKRFIPPMAQLPLSHTSWLVSMLPEFVWIGLLHHSCGDKRAAEIAVTVAKIATDTTSSDQRVWYAPTSNYDGMPSDTAQAIASRAGASSWFGEFRDALVPLGRLYPTFPMAFMLGDLGDPEQMREADLTGFKPVLAALFDRRQRRAMMVQATALYVAFVTGVMVANEQSSLANFPAVQDYPETEDSKLAGAAVRAAINGMTGLGLTGEEPRWPRQFWNRGLELEPCYFGTGA